MGLETIGLASQAINTGLQYALNKDLQFDAQGFNKSLFDENWKENYKWMEKYSTPLALKQQFEKAGFSPYAALGGSSSAPPSIASPQATPIPTDSKLDLNKAMQLESMQTEMETAKANKNYIEEQAEGQKIANDNARLLYLYNKDNLGLERYARIYNLLGNGWDTDKLHSIGHYLDTYRNNDEDKLTNPLLSSGLSHDNYQDYIRGKRKFELQSMEETFHNLIKTGKYTDALRIGQELDNEVNDLGFVGNVSSKYSHLMKLFISLLR